MQNSDRGWLSRFLPWLPLVSVWLGLACCATSVWMVVRRRTLSQFELVTPLNLYACCLGMTLGVVVLWGYRKRDESEPGIVQQRLQAKVGIGLSLAAVVVVYLLIMLATPVEVATPE